MLHNIKIALILIASCVLSQAQDLKAPPCSILSSTITCGGSSLTAGSGSVTSVSVTTANGISGVVATATSTPAITLTLGAITPTTIATTIISTNNAAYFHGSTATLTNYSGAQAATTLNGPVAGNPTKWIAISDNGVTRYIPAW